MSLVIDLIDLVAKHKSGELRCPATALIVLYSHHITSAFKTGHAQKTYTAYERIYIHLIFPSIIKFTSNGKQFSFICWDVEKQLGDRIFFRRGLT